MSRKNVVKVSIVGLGMRSHASEPGATPELDRLFVPSIDPTFLGREPADADGWCYVIDGLGVQGLPEPRYRG